MRTARAAVIAAVALLASSGSAGHAAGNNILNLGKPTNTLPPPPSTLLDGFRKTGPVLRQYGRPIVLFLGTMVDADSAAERWSLVKALEQFGTLSGVTATQTRSCMEEQLTFTCSPGGDSHGYPTGYPTYDLEHARYNSRYVVLDARDLIDTNAHVATNPSTTERRLFQRYVENADGAPEPATWSNLVWYTAVNPGFRDASRRFPLVSIGGYLRSSYGVALPGDLEAVGTRNGYTSEYIASFDVVQSALQSGRTGGGIAPTLVRDINAEANVITAFICHADSLQPKSVCTRPVVKQILKHIR